MRTGDRRVQRTRQQVRAALMSLIQERGYESLSVQDIIDRANVGRATFYAHFDSKEDLLASGIDELRTSLRARQRERALPGSPRRAALSFSRDLFAHAAEHRQVFRVMLGKRSGGVVQQLLRKMFVDLVREELEAARDSRDRASIEAASHFIAGGLLSLLVWWATSTAALSWEEMDAKFRTLAVPAVSHAIS